jgi:hypothetical protein
MKEEDANEVEEREIYILQGRLLFLLSCCLYIYKYPPLIKVILYVFIVQK